MPDIEFKVPSKNRLMYYTIRDYLDKTTHSCVVVVAGPRKIGKTVILNTLASEYTDNVFVTFNRNDTDSEDKKKRFMIIDALKAGVGCVFIDEVSFCKKLDSLVEAIKWLVIDGNTKTKVVLAGSSTTHLYDLHYGQLGGGRSKLFRMSFLSFFEYLYFTGKVDSYEYPSSYSGSEIDFQDYLLQNNFDKIGFSLSLGDEYLADLHRDIRETNRCTVSDSFTNDITLEGLLSVTDMISYTLTNLFKIKTLKEVDGDREESAFRLVKEPLPSTGLPFANMGEDLRLFLSLETFRGATKRQIRLVLAFLLESNLAYLDRRFEDRENKKDANKLARMLLDDGEDINLEDLFSQYNICLAHPHWYMQILKNMIEGGRIVNSYGEKVNINDLFNTPLYGLLIENYIKSSYSVLSSRLNYEVYTLGSPAMNSTNEERSKSAEVDLFDNRINLLMEITKGRKRKTSINLGKHFPTEECIRIFASGENATTSEDYYTINFTHVCIMIDLDIIRDLKPIVPRKGRGVSGRLEPIKGKEE